jgi:hypothetical protein
MVPVALVKTGRKKMVTLSTLMTKELQLANIIRGFQLEICAYPAYVFI